MIKKLFIKVSAMYTKTGTLYQDPIKQFTQNKNTLLKDQASRLTIPPQYVNADGQYNGYMPKLPTYFDTDPIYPEDNKNEQDMINMRCKFNITKKNYEYIAYYKELVDIYDININEDKKERYQLTKNILYSSIYRTYKLFVSLFENDLYKFKENILLLEKICLHISKKIKFINNNKIIQDDHQKRHYNNMHTIVNTLLHVIDEINQYKLLEADDNIKAEIFKKMNDPFEQFVELCNSSYSYNSEKLELLIPHEILEYDMPEKISILNLFFNESLIYNDLNNKYPYYIHNFFKETENSFDNNNDQLPKYPHIPDDNQEPNQYQKPYNDNSGQNRDNSDQNRDKNNGDNSNQNSNGLTGLQVVGLVVGGVIVIGGAGAGILYINNQKKVTESEKMQQQKMPQGYHQKNGLYSYANSTAAAA